MNNNKRVEWIDIAKAIAIILVGIGHYECPEELRVIIYIFHMPLFFVLSGFTLSVKKYKFGTFLLKKVKSLILPWILGLTVYVIFQNVCLKVGISAVNVPIRDIIPRIFINFIGGKFDPVYWFLPCIFLAELILYFLLKIFDNKAKTYILMSVCLVIAAVYEFMNGGKLAWEIHILPMASFYILLGYLIKNWYNDYMESGNIITYSIIGAGSFAAGAVIGYLNWYITGKSVSMAGGRYGIFVLAVIASILCILGVILLTHLMVNIRILKYIGRNSLLVYILQPYVYKITDILLCLCLPFYQYAANIFDLILLHVFANVFILTYIVIYRGFISKQVSKIVQRKKA